MRTRVTQNFRGARALVIHADDINRSTLVTTLGRLGLMVDLHDPSTPCRVEGTADVVFFDADQGLGNIFGEEAAPDVPLIALIGIEAPSRLTRVVRQEASSYIMKPIRSSGIFTALFMAFHEHSRKHLDAEAISGLTRRISARRDIVKAILEIMKTSGVDDDDAFRLLRREAMRRRIAIEEIAREMLAERGGDLVGGAGKR